MIDFRNTYPLDVIYPVGCAIQRLNGRDQNLILNSVLLILIFRSWEIYYRIHHEKRYLRYFSFK